MMDRNDCKKELKEIKIQKEGGYRKQRFIETASGLNKLRSAEMNDAIQDCLYQGNARSACKRCNLCLIGSCFLTGDEIPPYRDQAEDIS